MPNSQPELPAVTDSLRRSTRRLSAALQSMSDERIAGPSYDDDWSVGQVASHLGSGAEIFAMVIDAGLQGKEAPGPDQFAPVWEAWNAKDPVRQARDAVAADQAFLAKVDGLTPVEADEWRMELFGSDTDLAGVLRMRVSEHAAHTWDVVVMSDPDAGLAEDAVEAIIDTVVPQMVGYRSKGVSAPQVIDVTTTAPARRLLLTLGPDGAVLEAASDRAGADARLELPAEAFVRLLYGRLDPDHTPADVTAEGVDLDAIREAFPGL